MAAANNGNLPAMYNNKGSNISVKDTINAILDKDSYRRRFEDLLKGRTAQFVASLVSLVNADEKMMAVARENPVTIIQSALKAATYDLPIDPGLGFAYIVPFGGTATFIIGYKGLLQLAMRTGSYRKINVIDIRAGEIAGKNRLTEEFIFKFIENDQARNAAPIIGYCGYYQLVNGMEKTFFMSVEEIKAHELKHRKGNYMGKGWKDNFEAMARKTVLRNLLTKWGIMSIDYRTAALTDAIDDERQIINANANSIPLGNPQPQAPLPAPMPEAPQQKGGDFNQSASLPPPPPPMSADVPPPVDEPPLDGLYDGMAF